MQNRIFKIRCSAIGKIMGRIGLTEIQEKRLSELETRANDKSAKPLTDLMKAELAQLQVAKANPELPETCKSYLREWYAGDSEELHSKYLDKGIFVESENIDFAAKVLGYGLLDKCNEPNENEYFITDSCDVKIGKTIIEIKSSWNNESLQSVVYKGSDKDYEWQTQGYMNIYNCDNAILFYGLVNTPEEVNYGNEITFDHIPENERWIAFEFKRNDELVNQVIERVKLCREWLKVYDKQFKSRVGQKHLM